MSNDKRTIRMQIKRLLLTGNRANTGGMGGATLTGAGLSYDYFQVVDRLTLDGLHSFAALLEHMHRMGMKTAPLQVKPTSMLKVGGQVFVDDEPYNPDKVNDGKFSGVVGLEKPRRRKTKKGFLKPGQTGYLQQRKEYCTCSSSSAPGKECPMHGEAP